jgi:osmotically-inducible protein OsmY
MRQLEWDPEVDANALGVAVTHGTVMLTGCIDTYSGKLAAERAAKRVRGVRAVANDIEIRLRLQRTDGDLAQDVAQALELRSTIPETVQAVVRDGHVTLTGTVDWSYQKESAEDAVGHLRGVRRVANYITVAPKTVFRDLGHRIAKSLRLHADLDARQITVTVSGNTATLTGTVGTWLQRESAERTVANSPGIAHVDNRLTVHSSRDSTIDECDEVC